MKPLRTLGIATVLCAVSVLAAPAPAFAAGTVHLVSVTTGGVRGDNRTNNYLEVDGSGRYVAFTTWATNLSPAAPTGGLFIRDLDTGTTTLFSAGRDADTPTFDATGRHLAYRTPAALSAEDTDELNDIYVTDLLTGVTTLASPDAPDGVGTSRISDDGLHVAMVIDDGTAHVRDLQAGTTSAVGAGDITRIDISGDGRYVAFSSGEPGLVPADVDDGSGLYGADTDIFVRDMRTGALDQISVTWDGAQTYHTDTSVSISADGNRVVFASRQNDLVPGDITTGRHHRDVFLRDRAAGTLEKVDLNDAGEQVSSCICHQAVISADGRYVAFRGISVELSPDDPDAWGDIYVRDLLTGTNAVASPSTGTPDGHSEYPSVSAHGETVAFLSANTGLAPPDVNNRDDGFAWRR